MEMCVPPVVVQETFAKEGLNYSMEGKTGSTLNSHRLIALAGQQGLNKQDKLVELLFRAYFTQVQQHTLSSLDVSAVGPGTTPLCMVATVTFRRRYHFFGICS